MKFIKKGFVILLVVILLSFCTACAGMEGLADGLKDGVEQLDVNVTIGKSNALITPYQSFNGSRTSDHNTTYEWCKLCWTLWCKLRGRYPNYSRVSVIFKYWNL